MGELRHGAKSHWRGHDIVWIDDGRGQFWAYLYNLQPTPGYGGKSRPCGKCGQGEWSGTGAYDCCLGLLPGVDNACCGHGVREESYIRFKNGVVVRGFIVEAPVPFIDPDKEKQAKKATEKMGLNTRASVHEVVMRNGWQMCLSAMFWKLLISRLLNVQRPLNILSTFEITTDDFKDAERYRWLRAQHWSDDGMLVVARPGDMKITSYCPSGERLDKIIDEQLNA